MNTHERRRKRLLEAIRHHQERLDRLDPANHKREVDYRKARTFYEHRIRWGLKLLKGEGDNETESRDGGHHQRGTVSSGEQHGASE